MLNWGLPDTAAIVEILLSEHSVLVDTALVFELLHLGFVLLSFFAQLADSLDVGQSLVRTVTGDGLEIFSGDR